ncbi:unnamed protein product [Euphydryas editha]|uniref:Uncharacterized protein n=1 Tax=Euphydryas editha TaxID=104508 RepID=A0AAU9TT17_EUPED|nr:unnamed protein product [Euphydryas editha]
MSCFKTSSHHCHFVEHPGDLVPDTDMSRTFFRRSPQTGMRHGQIASGAALGSYLLRQEIETTPMNEATSNTTLITNRLRAEPDRTEPTE